MLGGCRNVNITTSALYVAMVHVFHYLVILYLLLWGISILLIMWRACIHTHTHTHICTIGLHFKKGECFLLSLGR